MISDGKIWRTAKVMLDHYGRMIHLGNNGQHNPWVFWGGIDGFSIESPTIQHIASPANRELLKSRFTKARKMNVVRIAGAHTASAVPMIVRPHSCAG